MTAATSSKILETTINLFREFGFNGTSIKQIVEASNTTTGSVYHFFPKGKDQLTADVISSSGPGYQKIIEDILDQTDDLPDAIYSVYEQAGAMLAATDYLDPCPIGGVAREVASIKPELRKAIEVVFKAWSTAIERRLRDAGVAAEDAADIGATIISSIEGGFILARTYRSPQPLLRIGRTLRAIVAFNLDD